MDGIESYLRLLDDENWHRITDLAKQLKWSLSRTMRIAVFLSEHWLVHYRQAGGGGELSVLEGHREHWKEKCAEKMCWLSETQIVIQPDPKLKADVENLKQLVLWQSRTPTCPTTGRS